jgi:hypothetical protein
MNVFDRLLNGKASSVIELGWWPHGARRLVGLEDADARAAHPLKVMARL